MNKHPTGIATAAAGVIVAIAKRLGVDLSVEEALSIVVLVSAVVSAKTPRIS